MVFNIYLAILWLIVTIRSNETEFKKVELKLVEYSL